MSSSLSGRKRKRSPVSIQESSSEEVERPYSQADNELNRKRQRHSTESGAVVDLPVPQPSNHDGPDNLPPIYHWVQEGTWPKEYLRSAMNPPPLVRKRSSSSFRGTQLESNSYVISREGKNPAARSLLYEKTLANAKIYGEDAEIGIGDDCKALCQRILNDEQPIAKDSLFADDVFWMTCRRLKRRNEAMVVRDIMPLIVPAAEILYTFGAKHLKYLTEEVNASWYKCFSLVTGPLPQPDYCVGFDASAFSESQLTRIEPFVGNFKSTHFMATEWMHFPFLTCEVKCGEQGLNVADRQNAHSASVCVSGVIELYRAVSRVKELHRKVLAFSVSHDNENVRIYGHYALTDGDKVSFYRHAITKYDFTNLDGRDKWIAYKFIKNLYDVFVPVHLDRIRSAIDQLPDPEVRLPQQPFVAAPTYEPEPGDSQSTSPYSRDTILTTPTSQTAESANKKARNQ